ncbi:ABC transporter permease [Paenibacillus aceris]|uniref:ABC-type nitrate/sulfonate/bicarbonate transport system permease component n=1 Tax=Paenibacillus aceris TaxID=869555 RepID=A0ABS4HST6_9BACL|nr:ABC transporter permease [Paenibacillus aceris]MBP1961658.1 ABC-type nitrate/sulfonate/bicarbonate transport system permease component [Paenibacillus aceris]
MKLKNGLKAGWPPIVVVILLLLIWQLAVTWGGAASWLLPSPLKIWQDGTTDMPRVWMHTFATVRLMLMGFIVGTVGGVIVASFLHRVAFLKAGFYPLLILSQNVPVIALGPLLIILFGFGVLPKLILIALVCFFPVTMSTLDGFMQTDRSMYNYMQMIGASKRQIFYKLELPHALPFLFTGLKISATYSVMGAVIAEWLGGGVGLGYYMILQKSAFRADREFVAILIIVVLSLLFFWLIAGLEKFVIRWNAKRSS